MKIIHLVLGKANPLRMNGVNKLVHEMVSSQKELGADVCLWGITKNTVHDYPKRNFETVLFPAVFNKTTIDPSIKKAIFDLKGDTVFHFHGSFIPEFFKISRLLVERGIDYVYTPHGALAAAALKRRGWKKKWYFELFEHQIVRDAKAIITTGKSGYINIDNLVKVKSKFLIPNGQPQIEFKANQFDVNQKPIFGYCGRIALEHKGLDLLLNGFRIFLDKGGDADLQIIGDGEELPKLKKIAASLKLFDHIQFHGAKYGDEKFQLLCETNMFVHTSRMEGFPASVLEAAALGLPCLISKDTNMDDYVEKWNCGIVLEQNTPQLIAEAMLQAQQLLKTGELKKMGENARTMIQEEFDWKRISKQLLSIYENKEVLLVEKPVDLIS